MEFGEPKSNFRSFIWTTIIAGFITLLVWCIRSIPGWKIVALFTGLEGTVWLASAFSASDKKRRQGSFVGWFFRGQGAVPVHYNRPMFWGGLMLLAVSIVLNTIGD